MTVQIFPEVDARALPLETKSVRNVGWKDHHLMRYTYIFSYPSATKYIIIFFTADGGSPCAYGACILMESRPEVCLHQHLLGVNIYWLYQVKGVMGGSTTSPQTCDNLIAEYTLQKYRINRHTIMNSN